MTKNCCRCGLNLEDTKKLRCKKCIQKVHEDLMGIADRPLEYYFKYYYKKTGKTK